VKRRLVVVTEVGNADAEHCGTCDRRKPDPYKLRPDVCSVFSAYVGADETGQPYRCSGCKTTTDASDLAHRVAILRDEINDLRSWRIDAHELPNSLRADRFLMDDEVDRAIDALEKLTGGDK